MVLSNHLGTGFQLLLRLALIASLLATLGVTMSRSASAQTTTFSNSSSITINTYPEASNPFPSTINVSGLDGQICTLTLTLHDLSVASIAGTSVLLVSPAEARKMVVMSEVGSGNVTNVTLTIDDAAADFLPFWWAPGTGTYRPTDYGSPSAGRVFSWPAPSGASRPASAGAATLTSVFGGIDPNGAWSLYVQDFWHSAGVVNGGWSLTITSGADCTPPVISPTVTGTLGQNGWYTNDVGVSWLVTDPDSAIASSTGCDATTIDADTAGTTLTCAATSAGGTASQSTTIKRDATAPTLNPSASPSATMNVGESVVVSPNASDAMSGVASQSCDAVDTSTPGTKDVTCRATDLAGNTAETTIWIEVEEEAATGYVFSGFQSPVNPEALNMAKAGQAIPLKFRVTDSTGSPVSDLTQVSVRSAGVACGIGGDLIGDPVEAYATGKSGLQNLGNGYYQFNWSTEKGWANICRLLQLDLGDGITHTALFHFKK